MLHKIGRLAPDWWSMSTLLLRNIENSLWTVLSLVMPEILRLIDIGNRFRHITSKFEFVQNHKPNNALLHRTTYCSDLTSIPFYTTESFHFAGTFGWYVPWNWLCKLASPESANNYATDLQSTYFTGFFLLFILLLLLKYT